MFSDQDDLPSLLLAHCGGCPLTVVSKDQIRGCLRDAQTSGTLPFRNCVKMTCTILRVLAAHSQRLLHHSKQHRTPSSAVHSSIACLAVYLAIEEPQWCVVSIAFA